MTGPVSLASLRTPHKLRDTRNDGRGRHKKPGIKEPQDSNSLDHFAWFTSRIYLPKKVDEEKMALFYLADFQADAFEPYFDGVIESSITWPKKLGKSASLGALGLHHLRYEVEEADVVLVAAARNQARRVFNFSAGFVTRTEWLQEIFKCQPGYPRIILKDGSPGELRTIANDANTNDGEGNTLTLIDEYHRWRSSELYALLREGLAARNGRLLSASTMGDSEQSPFGQLRKAALELPGSNRIGVLITSRDGNNFFYTELSLPEGADVEDFDLVAQANPLYTAEQLRRRFNSPTMEAWQWARFVCGLPMSGENAAIDPRAWLVCATGFGLQPGEPCWCGMDVGWRIDSTALVPFVLDADGEEIVGRPTIIPAPGNGTDTEPDVILDAIGAVHERNPIEALVFDPRAEGRQLATRIRDELGIRIVEHSQDPSPMSDASMGLAESVRARRIVHPNDTELNMHVTGAGAKSIATGSARWRLVKRKGSGQIDAAIALAMVRHARVGGASSGKSTSTLEDYIVV